MAGPSLIAEGDFDPNARYVVTVSNQVQGVAGYGLSMQEKWGASFRPKHGAILFPERQIRQRSVLGLNFAFYGRKPNIQVRESAYFLPLSSINPGPSVEEVKKLLSASGSRFCELRVTAPPVTR